MSLKLIIGCMFSGKTTEIIKIINRLNKINKKVLIITSKLDNRYTTDSICSHDNLSIKSKSINNDEILSIKNDIEYKNSEYIIIDEAQFFKDLKLFVKYSIDYLDKHLIVVGLNCDTNQNNFGEIKELYPIAEEIILLKALCENCKDGTEAIFSYKKTNNQNIIDIGGENEYEPLCRKCFNSKI